jgi:acetyl-CoA carboxylase biotin carboxyl carrier protein
MAPRPAPEADPAAGGSPNRPDSPRPMGGPELGTVLEQVRHHTTLLLSQLSAVPRLIRMRAGEVALDIEWDTAGGLAGPLRGEQLACASENTAARVLSAHAVGVFYRAPEPGGVPFVSPGDLVVIGQQVAIIEAMKLMIPVEADLSGRIIDVLKDDGEPVEYGEPLFALAVTEHT